MEDIRLKGGIFAIGSLKWEESEIRRKWRLKNLNPEENLLVDLPIRYGRISTSRNCTYTMVYSSNCKLELRLGKGFFIPFKNNPIRISEIFNQAKQLIIAEHNKEIEFQRHNWGWGAVGITINPNFFKNSDNKNEIEELLNKWAEKYSPGFDPNDYKVNDEDPIVSEKGILKIDWPKKLNEFDFVLGATCKPEIYEYPSPKKIAQRILVNEYDEYFKQNREHSIKTFQDDKITAELNNLNL